MEQKKGASLFERVAVWIVDKRGIIFLLYVCACIFCIFSMGWTQVENDVTKYLPEHTETRQGIDAMNRNFVTPGTARVMVNHVSYETALALSQEMGRQDQVAMVVFDDTPDHYRDAAALFDVNFSGPVNAPQTIAAMDAIRELLSDYDVYVDTTVGFDENAMLDSEMLVILIVAVFIIIIVLTTTSRAYMEVVVLLITFGVAALLNMGTNFLFGKISFISDSIAVVLQLALAIDYAIILCHRFTDVHETRNARDSAIIALSKSIPEIGASSLTTISGLMALGFMEFAIGMDMAMVLIKAILLSMLTVFTLMPGLLVLFGDLIDKTRHKKLLPDVSFIGRFAVKSRKVVPVLFILSLGGAFWLSSQCPYAYSYNDLRTPKMSDRQNAYFTIKDHFGPSNMVALLVPVGDYDRESQVIAELSAMPQVKSTMALSGIEALEGHTLTEAMTPRQLSELLGLDYEVIQLLYSAYAAQNSELGAILTGLEEYEIPLFDMFLFLKDQMETNNITLPAMDGMDIGSMLGQLDTAKSQMQSQEFSRMVIYLNLPEESQETFDFLATIREVVGKYYDGNYYVVGNSTSSRDLSASFAKDNLMISLLSAFFVIIVLLFTFQSAGMSLLLIAVIQGSIWINFSYPTVTGTPMYFLGYLIVQALQMGANIDYAIVISSHYQEKKREMPHKEAIVAAVNAAFPTVFTSGTMMSSAGLLIGNLSAQPVVSIMGMCIGRGTIISIFLVLFVLPAFLVLGDSIINRTSFHLKGLEPKVKTAQGKLRVTGHVRGYVCGMVDADFSGTLQGTLEATVSTQGELIQEGASAHE